MIEPSYADFPDNVIQLSTIRIPTAIDADLSVYKRPLRPSDGEQSVAVFPQTGLPNEQSTEFYSRQPTLRRYNLVFQSMVKGMEEDRVINVHSILTQRIWNMWFADEPLHIGLTSLAVTRNNVRERFQRRGIVQQRYISNEMDGNYFYSSWTEVWFETETVTL